MRLFAIGIALIIPLNSALLGDSLAATVAVYPQDNQPSSIERTKTFASDLRSRAILDLEGDPELTGPLIIDQLEIVTRPATTLRQGTDDLAKAASLTHSTAIIWNHVFTANDLASIFYLSDVGGTGLPVRSISFRLQGPAGVETAGSALQQHEIVLAYLASVEAYKAGRYKESLEYLDWGEGAMTKPVTLALAPVQRQMEIVRQLLLKRTSHVQKK